MTDSFSPTIVAAIVAAGTAIVSSTVTLVVTLRNARKAQREQHAHDLRMALRRDERDEATRLRQLCLTAYGDFIASADALLAAMQPSVGRIDPAKIEERVHALVAAFQPLRLLAPKKTSNLARLYLQAVLRAADEPANSELAAAAGPPRLAFTAAARAEIRSVVDSVATTAEDVT